MTGTFARDHPEPEEVMAWIDGESVDGGVERHVAACARCRGLVGDVRDVSARLAAWTVEPAPLQIPRRQKLPHFQWRYVAMAALLVIGLLTWSSMHDWTARQRVQVGAPADGAAVVVTVFLDWQCPTCTHLEYATILAAYEAAKPGAVRYVIKDYPLNARCNANLPVDAPAHHAAACEAAAAVRMARQRGKADEFIDWIFANQRDLTAEAVKTQAASMLGVRDFDAEYARMLGDIRRDVADGAALHVQFTPAVFVNGVPASRAGGGPPSPQELDWAIQSELKRAGR